MTRKAGFTLIELLVVITIMTTLLSLVGPLMIEQVDKTRAAAEYQQLEQYISDSAKVAFLKGQAVRFSFDGKQLKRDIGTDQSVIDFQYLFFMPQSLLINANGFSRQQHIKLRRGNTELRLELAELL